jgi:ATP-dependent RNA helicase RhlE
LSTFKELGLCEELLKAVADQGYENPTPIQTLSIPPLLDGRDVLGCAQTGTGKTAAFALPVLQHLNEYEAETGLPIRALILSPTRELAAQIGDCFEQYSKYTDLSHCVIFGGVNEKPQIRALKEGFDTLIATPGRLLDLLGRGYIDLSEVEFFVLDEADRMLDMGFIHDIRRVLKELPTDRMNLLFSATMPPNIVELGSFLDDPVRVDVAPEQATVEKIEQRLMYVERADKRKLLVDIIEDLNIDRALVFTRTKHGANRLVKQMSKAGITAAPIHGNKSQNARRRALDGFKDGSIPFLVATDIASRGIDVDGIGFVFNFDLPNEPEVYVHRIGRTGRAGRSGLAISFCDSTERGYLRDIERLIKMKIPVDDDHDYPASEATPTEPSPRRGGRGGRSNDRGSRGQGTGNQGRRRRRRPAPGDAIEGREKSGQSKPQPGAAEGSEAPKRRRRRRRRRRPQTSPTSD